MTDDMTNKEFVCWAKDKTEIPAPFIDLMNKLKEIESKVDYIMKAVHVGVNND
tara:strand:- start:185 stop:343 length:159 start_codon:yes stop_codon:yes gene_type:complete